jgi:hypothetical protein
LRKFRKQSASNAILANRDDAAATAADVRATSPSSMSGD